MLTFIQVLMLIIILLILTITFFTRNDLFSPAKLFTLIWCFVIFLTEFKFSLFQRDWSLFSWLILFIGLISFLIGNFVSYIINLGTKIKTINDLRTQKYILATTNFNKLYIAILWMFIIYIISFIGQIIIKGTIPILDPKPDFARMNFSVFGISLLVGMHPILMFLCVQYLLFKKNQRGKLIIFSILILTFVSYSTLLIRYNYFVWAIMSFILIYYTSKVLNVRNILIGLVVFIFILSLIQSIRLSQYAEQFLYVTSAMKYSPKYASFTGFYMYIVMNLENFAYSVDKLTNYAMGFQTFDWFFALTGIKHQAAEYFNIDYRKFISTGYNTLIYLWDYYYDFGVLGMSILSGIQGYIFSFVYYRMRLLGTLEWISLYCFCTFAIIISFFNNPFSPLFVIANLIILIFIQLLIKK